MPALPIETWHWLAFGAFVVVMLTLDLTVFHRHSHETSLREAAVWTVVWCSLALAFNGLIWFWRGQKPAIEFLTGYLIEWSLSMDNVFVFAVIFSFFRVPLKYQYRVLFWGILGAIIMRLTFVLVGAALIKHFDWMMPDLRRLSDLHRHQAGVSHDDEQVDPEQQHPDADGPQAVSAWPAAITANQFFVRENGGGCASRRCSWCCWSSRAPTWCSPSTACRPSSASPSEPFIVFTSNIFAILGLRALYFLLAGVMDMFRYLNYGLSAVLVFVGVKMVADYAVHVPAVAKFISDNLWQGFHVEEGHHLLPPAASLVIVLSLLGISIVASIIAKSREDRRAAMAGVSPPKDTPPMPGNETSNGDAAVLDAEPVERSTSKEP